MELKNTENRMEKDKIRDRAWNVTTISGEEKLLEKMLNHKKYWELRN